VCAVVRRDPRRHTFRGLDGQREVGAVLAIGLTHHERQAQLAAAIRREREADEPAAETRHEVDVGGRYLFGGHHQVSFVLPVLVVHDHDHAPGGDVGEDFFDGVERFHEAFRRST
jgi:hypothetical protein